MLRFILISALFFGVLNAQSGLSYLNGIRTKAGLIKLKPNKLLNKASKAHARYLVKHQIMSHNQKRGYALFSGKNPSQRALAVGYKSAFVMENLTVNTANQKKSIDNLFSAIYHRFVFLTLDKDEIGMGISSSPSAKRIKKAFVYDLGSSHISKLCRKTYPQKNGIYYVQNICKDTKKMIPKTLYTKTKNRVRGKNKKIVLFPYANQRGVSPVFYNESPDPLPRYGVSGYPVSVQLNPAFYNKIKLKSFRLYSNGKEMKKIKILQYKNDHNKLFTKSQFALMPLKRLEFATTYTAVFKATADGKSINKKWSFVTQKPKGKIYKITKKSTHLVVKRGSKGVLYFVPNSKNDLIRSYSSRGGLKVSFIDLNTLKVTFPNRKSTGRVSLDLGSRKVSFDIQ